VTAASSFGQNPPVSDSLWPVWYKL